jgi:uncharacterized membrane protein
VSAHEIVKTIHILSSTVLIGTGAGIAFFMLCSRWTDNLHEKFYAARFTVLADFVFTLPAVILQPVTGYWLVRNGGYDMTALWLKLTYALYLLAGACWLPVVWMQIQFRKMLAEAVKTGAPLPDRYHRLFRLWICLGIPAFSGLVVVFFLMVMKPV